MGDRYFIRARVLRSYRATVDSTSARATCAPAARKGSAMHTLALAQTHPEAAPFDSFAPTPFAVRAIPDTRQGNAVTALMRALAERYPVVCRLAGEQSFLGAARGYVLTQPPRSADLLQYGETFPRFLRS